MTNTSRKRILSGILVLCMIFTFIPMIEPASAETGTDTESCCYDCLRTEYTIDNIREMFNNGEQIYRDLRVHYEDTGVMTYRVPVPDSEIEYLLNTIDGNVQPRSVSSFEHTRIIDSGLEHDESIVIVILGDAFTYDEYGTWPNPAQGTVLYHAYDVMSTMLDTHPFGLFRDLFTVYVVHSHGPDRWPGTAAGYFGTVVANPSRPDYGSVASFTHGGVTLPSRVRNVANQVVGGAEYEYRIDMIQVISNARYSGGFAGSALYQPTQANVAVTSIRYATCPPGGSTIFFPDGTGWHGTFVHEFGHSFGGLIDEHAGGSNNERFANSTVSATLDEDVKWIHWGGHRNVLTSPTRLLPIIDGGISWAIPSAGSRNRDLLEYGCIMASSWANRNFCGVCTAELIRRMALISGEPFYGRSPATYRHYAPYDSPNYPWVYTPVVDLGNVPKYGIVTRILDSAFHGNTSVETVHIPASVATIGDFAFIGTENLRTIHNQRTIPQQINNTTFAGLDRSRITVHVPVGTIPAYIEAGWGGFRLVDGAGRVAYPIKFHFYGIDTTEYTETSALSGHSLNMTNVFSAMEDLDDCEDANMSRFAFWGWFTEEALSISGRYSTASNVAPGLRRPVVGTEGFDVDQVITQEMLDRYANSDGVIHLRSVWSLWGDVNDDGLVNPVDANLLFQHVGHAYGAPAITLPAADVFRDGRVDPTDANVLFQHVGHVFGAPPLGVGPQPAMRSGIETAQWQISYDASLSSETVTVGVSLYESTQHGMGLTLLTVQYDSALLSNPRVVPNLRLDRDRFGDMHYMFYDLLSSWGYTEADMVLHPVFTSVVVDDSAYHNNFIFDYLVHPQHILSPDMIVLRWNNSSVRMPYMGSDIFVNITFDVAPGAQIADRGAVQFTDEHQFMGWAVGTGSNQLILID